MPGISLKIETWAFEVGEYVFEGGAAKKFVDRIVDDLHGAAIGLTRGTNLVSDQLPDTKTRELFVAVRDLGGIPSSHPAPEMLVQFFLRGGSYVETRDMAAKIYNRYHCLTSKNIPGYRIITAVCQALPASIGLDANQRSQVLFNVIFRAHSTGQTPYLGTGFGGKRDPNEA